MLDLGLELLEEAALDFAHFAATKTGDMNVISRPMAFIIVLITAKMKEVELVNQAVALEEVDGAIHRDPMNAGIDLVGAVENSAGIEVLFGIIHYLNDGATLARQADTPIFKGSLKPAGLRRRINTLARRYTMCGSGGHSVHCGQTKQRLTARKNTQDVIIYDDREND
jgi:hypothetical protein